MTVIEIIEYETGEKVASQSRFEDMKLDSLEFLELMQVVSEKTGKEIPDASLSKIVTVEDLERVIANGQ